MHFCDITDMLHTPSMLSVAVQVRDAYSSKSFRLMAMAVGVLHNVDALDLPHMSLPEIEAHALQLEMLSLIVLSNQIRPDSRGVINQLQQGYANYISMHSKFQYIV